MKKISASILCAGVLVASTIGANAETVFTVGNLTRPGTAGSTTVVTGATGNATNGGLVGGSVVYTVTGLDLTAEGGTASESFTFTIAYTATNGTPAANAFGNMAVTGGPGGSDPNQIDGTETLTGTVSLTSSTFAGLSLDGFTYYQGAGFGVGEIATITHGGGSLVLTRPTAADISSPRGAISGTSYTHTPTSGGTNTEALKIQFTAVPEPTSAVLFGLGGLALILRRRK